MSAVVHSRAVFSVCSGGAEMAVGLVERTDVFLSALQRPVGREEGRRLSDGFVGIAGLGRRTNKSVSESSGGQHDGLQGLVYETSGRPRPAVAAEIGRPEGLVTGGPALHR